MVPIPQATVVSEVSRHTQWMFGQRVGKLIAAGHETMSVNPLLLPILFEFHGATTFGDLAELLLAGHLMQGHNTSFGKLIDEKIVPGVFGTHKLTKGYRASHPPFINEEFNEIDHVVIPATGLPTLLSLKMSRWTIQLSMAQQLNRAFAEIVGKVPGHAGYRGQFAGIVVGVVVGKRADMTDKYDILRGINRGAHHGVIDVQQEVTVLTGREFWTWLNQGEPRTQDWVLEGILHGVRAAASTSKSVSLLTAYETAFNQLYAKYVLPTGGIDWQTMLTDISG